MSYVADMSPWSAVPGGELLTAIGWLERGHPYATGANPEDVLSVLDRIRERNLSIVRSLGVHLCPLCPPRARGEQAPPPHVGRSSLIVPDGDRIFVFPDLITHYIRDHGYAPPEVFCAAVRRCPAPESEAYLALVAQCRADLAAAAVVARQAQAAAAISHPHPPIAPREARDQETDSHG